jgi:hypothetical protein
MTSIVFGKSDGETYLSYMMGFPTVKAWLEAIKDGHASNATKDLYSWSFYQFCKDMSTDPETLLQERERESFNQDPKVRFRAEDRLRQFFKGGPAIPATGIIGAAVKSFYCYHRYDLKQKTIAPVNASPADYEVSGSEILKMYLAKTSIETRSENG